MHDLSLLKLGISTTLVFLFCVGYGQIDSMSFEFGTDLVDSTVVSIQQDSAIGSVRFSKSGPTSRVDYGALDTMYLDATNKVEHLYGEAYVRYEETSIEANYIRIDLEQNTATAEGYPDSAGVMSGFPMFTDGEQTFTAQKMIYNFKTKKGKVYDITTQYTDLYVHGAETKFVAGSGVGRDTNDVAFFKSTLITTCDHPEPHYGIRSSKQKIISGKNSRSRAV